MGKVRGVPVGFVPAVASDVGNPAVSEYYNDRGQCWRVKSRVNRWRANRSRAWVGVKFGLYSYDRVYADNVAGLWVNPDSRLGHWSASYGVVLRVPGVGVFDVVDWSYSLAVVGCVWDVPQVGDKSALAALYPRFRDSWGGAWDYLSLEWRGF